MLVDPKTGKPFPKTVKWRFTGSVMTQARPEQGRQGLRRRPDRARCIAIFPVTDQTVFQTSLTMKEEKFMKLETNTKVLPKEGTPVKLIIEAAAK